MPMVSVNPTRLTKTGLPHLSLNGLGLGTCNDSGACGENPCGWFDNIWISDACRNFCKCSDPTSWGAIGADVALGQEVVGAAGVIGSAAGTAVGNAVGGVGAGVSSTAGPLFTYSLIAIGALAVFMLLKK